MTSSTTEPQVFVRPVCRDDRDEFLELMQASRDLHEPWISPPLTTRAFDAYLTRMNRSDHEGLIVRRSVDPGHRRRHQPEQHRAWFVPERIARLLRGSSLRGPGLHDERTQSGSAFCIRRSGSAPARGEHPAEQCTVHQSRQTLRLRERGFFAEVSVHRRRVARPRALGNPTSPRYTPRRLVPTNSNAPNLSLRHLAVADQRRTHYCRRHRPVGAFDQRPRAVLAGVTTRRKRPQHVDDVRRRQTHGTHAGAVQRANARARIRRRRVPGHGKPRRFSSTSPTRTSIASR